MLLTELVMDPFEAFDDERMPKPSAAELEAQQAVREVLGDAPPPPEPPAKESSTSAEAPPEHKAKRAKSAS
jgi:hypothetical protein